MMDYVVKYSIANCVFGYMSEAQPKADMEYIGIFSLSAKGEVNTKENITKMEEQK